MRWKRARPTTAADLSFHYEQHARSGVIDQTLSIRNSGSSAVTVRLTFTPLDARGEPLPEVATTTAYGTEAGRHVLAPGFTDVDVLSFHGPRHREVADVRVRVDAVETVPFASKVREVVLADRIDASGQVVSGGWYEKVRLTNINREPVDVRIALIEYERPQPGFSQQAVDVRQLGGLVTVPARGSVVVPGPTEFPDAFVSVKAYFSR